MGLQHRLRQLEGFAHPPNIMQHVLRGFPDQPSSHCCCCHVCGRLVNKALHAVQLLPVAPTSLVLIRCVFRQHIAAPRQSLYGGSYTLWSHGLQMLVRADFWRKWPPYVAFRPNDSILERCSRFFTCVFLWTLMRRKMPDSRLWHTEKKLILCFCHKALICIKKVNNHSIKFPPKSRCKGVGGVFCKCLNS